MIGTEPILKIELIKNNRVIYTHPMGTPAPERVAFSFRDDAGGGFEDSTMYPSSQIKDWSKPETGIRPASFAFGELLLRARNPELQHGGAFQGRRGRVVVAGFCDGESRRPRLIGT